MPLRTHPGLRRRARDTACVALVVLQVFLIVLGMAAMDMDAASFKSRGPNDDPSAVNAPSWPLPGEARPPAPQAQPLCTRPRLIVQVILLLMVPVGWMAPPGVGLHRNGQVQTIG